MKGKKKINVPTYICACCGMILKYTLTCHYIIEVDKEHKCKPILKPPSQKMLEEVAELQRYNESMSKTDKERLLRTKPKAWWRKNNV
jgi:hypothetical protein